MTCTRYKQAPAPLGVMVREGSNALDGGAPGGHRSAIQGKGGRGVKRYKNLRRNLVGFAFIGPWLAGFLVLARA
jgi:hypothetical protein